MKTLTYNEVEQVSGGFAPLVAGAALGGIGAGLGYLSYNASRGNSMSLSGFGMAVGTGALIGAAACASPFILSLVAASATAALITYATRVVVYEIEE